MKYFVVSDIHGFFDEFKLALTSAGFEYDNPEHILIVCGDIFDRGDQPLEVYNYIRKLPKKRRILIRGNHEYLLRDLVKREEAWPHDYSNGTYYTLFGLASTTFEEEKRKEYNLLYYMPTYGTTEYAEWWDKLNKVREKSHNKIFKGAKIKAVLRWIFESNEWVDWYELDKYIFVHAFIPLYKEDSFLDYYDVDPNDLKYDKDWRNIKAPSIIEGSTWGCPWKNYKAGLFNEEAKNGKILVCGHWHVYDFFRNLGNKQYQNNEELDFDIYKGKNIIALDACTVYSHQVNVLIIDEDMKPYIVNKKGKEVALKTYPSSL